MFQPLEWFIGLRYLSSRRRRGVVSFMTGASLVGIALGVAALIVILSIMNGLETETRTRLLTLSAHATLTNPGGLDDWEARVPAIATLPNVRSVAPYIMLEAMLSGAGLRPALVRGIAPEGEASIPGLEDYVSIGNLDALTPGSRRILLGQSLAILLGVRVGDYVSILVPQVIDGRLAPPRLTAFEVAGIFQAGIAEHDSSLALVHLADASELKGLSGAPQGLAVQLRDPVAVESFRAAALAAAPDLRYSDWSEEHRSLFTAIAIEKIMMTIILMFIVGVAAFNIVASLMMVVIDKEKDIAILRTCGLAPGRVARVFVVQGALIGVVGVAIGEVLGLALAYNVGTIVPWLESTFNFQIMPGDVYYVTDLPSEVQTFDVVMIPLAAFLIAALATVYPARRAAAIAPAAALRYE